LCVGCICRRNKKVEGNSIKVEVVEFVYIHGAAKSKIIKMIDRVVLRELVGSSVVFICTLVSMGWLWRHSTTEPRS